MTHSNPAPLAAALVNSNCGLAFGYAIGIFAVINSYQQELTACDKFTAKSACEGAKVIGSCEWLPNTNPKTPDATSEVRDFEDWLDLTDVAGNATAGGAPMPDGVCVYPNNATDTCAELKTSDSCAVHKGCGWDKDAKGVQCRATGERWSTTLQGLYSTLFVVGCTLGGPITPLLLNKGRKPTLWVMGALNLVGQLLLSGGWHWNLYGLQVFARIISGVAGGIACVVGPIYSAEKQGHREWIGCLFQFGCVIGIALAAVFGAILDPTSATGAGSKFGEGAHTQLMLQVVIHIGTVLSVLIFPVILFSPESLEKKEESDEHEVDEQSALIQKGDDEAATGGKGKQILKYLVPIVAVCGCQQLTGINAIMNYAPQIMEEVGVKPLLGNMYLMLWNFIMTPISIPLVKKVKPKLVYYVCGFLITLAGFLAFIPSYPGIITSDSASQGLGLFAIFFFVAAFAIGVGPCFFILAQDMFPKHLMGVGTSVTISVTMFFNVLINFSFPVLVKAFGGADNDAKKGQAFTFLLFASCGIVCCLTMLKFVPKLRSELEAEASAVTQDDEEEE